MHIIFLSRWFPYPPDNGAKIRIYNLLRHLAARHRVSLITFAEGQPASEQVAALRQFCQRVEVVPYQPFRPRRMQAMLGFFAARPRSVKDTYQPAVATLLETIAQQDPPDAVIASQVDMALYPLALRGVPRILEEIEISTLYEQHLVAGNPIQHMRRYLMWRKWAGYLAMLLREYDGYTVVSETERSRLARGLNAMGEAEPDAASGEQPAIENIEVIPNGVDCEFLRGDFGAPQCDTLAFTGALTYNANLDGLEYFLGEVFPGVRAERPQARLYVTGKVPGSLNGLPPQEEGVTFTGYLADVRPLVATRWASIVPLRIGGGTRLKILESLALGTPVISTPKGAEGLAVQNGKHLLLAGTPETFTATVLRLLDSSDLRDELARNGRQLVAERYDWRIIGPTFCDFVESIVASKKASH